MSNLQSHQILYHFDSRHVDQANDIAARVLDRNLSCLSREYNAYTKYLLTTMNADQAKAECIKRIGSEELYDMVMTGTAPKHDLRDLFSQIDDFMSNLYTNLGMSEVQPLRKYRIRPIPYTDVIEKNSTIGGVSATLQTERLRSASYDNTIRMEVSVRVVGALKPFIMRSVQLSEYCTKVCFEVVI